MVDLTQWALWAVILLLLVSLFVLSRGADLLVDNAVLLSKRWGISQVVIGATVVALGTTVPEFSASAIAAVGGNGGFAVGNAVGSIITNTSLVLGLGAVVGSIPVTRTHSRKLTFLIILLAIFLVSTLIPLGAGGGGTVLRPVGFVMLLALPGYFYWMIRSGRQEQLDQVEVYEFKEEWENARKVARQNPAWQLLLKMALAILLITLSASLLVDSAETIALRFGVSSVVIASTIVAFGTSVPEVTTALAAARSGHGGLALGNVMGANVLNILLVVGASTILTPGGIPLPGDFYRIHVPVMVVVLVVYAYFAYNTRVHELHRKEGILLVVVYLVYLGLNFMLTA